MSLFSHLRVAAAKNVARRGTPSFAQSAFAFSSSPQNRASLHQSRINPVAKTWITSSTQHSFLASRRPSTTSRFLSSTSTSIEDIDDTPEMSFFSEEYKDFQSLGVQSPILLKRLTKLQLTKPTQVQAQAYSDIASGETDITVGAETGSGKTLAYLLPILDDILQKKQRDNSNVDYDYARAIILVPNKELVQQVVRMALPLAGGPNALLYGGNTLVDQSILSNNQDNQQDESTMVRMAIFPGGLKEPQDFPPFRNTKALGGTDAPVDLIITTPASIGPLALKPKHIDLFADIETLIIDEADMLLDGGYIKALEQVLMGFRRADRLANSYNNDESMGLKKTQHVFVAATLPDYGLRSVDAYLQKKFPKAKRVSVQGMHMARHSGLAEQTKWILEESKRARMQELVRLLETPVEEGGIKDEKAMIFLNKVQDVEAACDALNRAGYDALPYHAKVSLKDRVKVLERFRQYNKGDLASAAEEENTNSAPVPMLVCTDLAARGLDVPGVTAVVQLEFAGNVVAHLHRMGRCGRAGQKDGRGIVFYSNQEAPLIEVVREAEQEQLGGGLKLEGSQVDESIFDSEEGEDENEDGESKEPRPKGAINKAFSRKRGFTNKRKKLLRKQREEEEAQGYE